MSALSSEDQFVTSICNAAYRSDAAAIATYLGIEKNTIKKRQGDLDESLRTSSPKANALHTNLFESSKLCSDIDKGGQLLRALLLVPPWYETPWNAALALVRCFHNQSGFLKKTGVSRRQLLTFVTEVQSFLQESARAWLVPDHTTTTSTASLLVPASAANRSSLTPRIMLEKIARVALDPVFQISTAVASNASLGTTGKNKTENDHWSLPFELLPSLLSICRTLEPDEIAGSTTTTTTRSWISMLNVIFVQNQSKETTLLAIRKDRLLQWLTLVSDVRSYLRRTDWTRLRRILQDFFNQERIDHDKIPQDDFPGLVRSTVSFLSHVCTHNEFGGSNDDDSEENVANWDELVLQVLYSATTHTAMIFSTVETVLKSSISSLSNLVLHQWIDALMQRQSESERLSQIPDWVISNLLLMLLQAAQQSGSQLVSDLVSQAFGNAKRGNLARRSWDVLVSMTFPLPNASSNHTNEIYQVSKGKLKNVGDQIVMLEKVQAYLEDSYYGRNGQFFGHQNIEISEMSHCTSLICQSLFLGSTSSDAAAPGKRHYHRIFCSERAQLWFHAVQSILRVSYFATTGTNAYNRLNVQDMLLAVLVIVTVYIEIPDSRKTLVRTMLEHFTAGESTSTTSKATVLARLYCIGISVIIRSMERNYVYCDKLDTMDHLKPISDTYSKSMPKTIFLHLASATIHLTSSRSALLIFAKDCLNSPGMWCGLTGNVNRGDIGGDDRIECTLHALCLLLADSPKEQSSLSSREIYFHDRCGREAWAILSDLIILNRPSLSMSARRFMFHRLQSCIEGKDFSNQKMSRLLRTCIVLFLQYCTSDSNSFSLIFEPEKAFVFWRKNSRKPNEWRKHQREDFGALLRLILSLATNIKTSAESPNMLSSCHGRIFELLSSANTKSSPTSSKVFDLRTQNDRRAVNTSSKVDIEIGGILTLCIDAIMRCLLISELPHISTLHEAIDPLGKVNGLLEKMRSELRRVEQDLCNADAKYCEGDMLDTPELPKWVQSKLQPLLFRCPGKVDHGVLNPVLSSLSDVMIALVIGRDQTCHTESVAEVRQILGALCALVDLKRKYSNTKAITTGSTASSRVITRQTLYFDQDIVYEIAPRFFEVASTSFRELTECCTYESLEEVEKILQLALSLCSSIQNFMQDSPKKIAKIVRSTQTFQSLWKFYSTVGDEKSAKYFIRYLEGTCLESTCERPKTTMPEPTLLLAIKSDSEVDKAVQHLRSKLLMTMQSTFPRVSDSYSQLSTECLLPNSSTLSISVENSKDLDFTFWCSCLKTFSTDLKLGVQGDSGGITTTMFQMYLDLIELSTKAILSKCNESGVQPPCQVELDTQQAALQLREVICKISLKSLSMLKKMLILSFHLLPSVHRVLALTDLFNGTRVVTGRPRPFDEFAITVLEQCICILEQWDGSAVIPSLPGAAIADDKLTRKAGNDDEFSHNSDSISKSPSGRQISEQHLPSVVVIPNQGSNCISGEETGETLNLDLKFSSADTFSLAYCCALLSMEHKWRDSYQIIQKMNKSYRNILVNDEDNTIRFFTEKVKELSDIIRVTCLLFKSSKNNDLRREEKLERGTMHVIAQGMKVSGKLRLCSLLDRVAVVLKKSIQKLSLYIQNPNSIFDLVIAESLTCIVAWLCRADIDTDFSSGLRRWYQVEQAKRPEGGLSGAQTKSAVSVVTRLPKVLFRIEELDWSVQKLSEVCSKHSSIKVSDLDEFTGRIYDALSGDKNDWSSSTMSNMIEQKLKMSKSVEPGIALIDAFAERAIEEEPINKRKKSYRNRGLEQKMRKERRRRLKRSRNTVVDEMLQRDQEQGHDEGNDADDAYVDLEDFLAEG